MKAVVYLVVLFVAASGAGFCTVHTVGFSGFSFSPPSLSIVEGDTVQFVLSAMHNAVEVDSVTWEADGALSNGGFVVPFGGGTAVPSGVGTHFYVCEAHVAFGMKATITVTPALPDTLTIKSRVDVDGDIVTTNDQITKKWGLMLYKNSISPGNLIGSVGSGSSLVFNDLPPGTYIAVEADSLSWSVVSAVIDGIAQAPEGNQKSISLGTGQNRSLEFINFAPHTIISSGFTFLPDSISIITGDTVHFVLDPMHDVVEVDSATWLADGSTPNGGFHVPFGGGMAVPIGIGRHFYVCEPHAAFGMKGKILVAPAPVVPPDTLTLRSVVDVDGSILTTNDQIGKNWSLTLYKNSISPGNLIGSISSDSSLVLTDLTSGAYIAVEGDSVSWSVVGVNIDGAAQTLHSNQKTITIGSGENHTLEFINFAPHTIISSGFTFLPDSIFVFPGDTIHFVLDPMHDAREVSQAAWSANDVTSNGGFDLSFGGGDAVLTLSGIHYYICTVHASLSMKGRITVSNNAPIRAHMLAGWNMISVPATVPDGSVSALYPAAVSSAFAYQGSYIPQSILTNGPGYWLKFDGAQTVLIAGTPLTNDTINVSAGWNMIGSISTSVLNSVISSLPPGIITSQFFGYGGSYFVADSIVPGYGYWVKVATPGKLIVASGPGTAFAGVQKQNFPSSSQGRLVLHDAAGNKSALYLLGANERSANVLQMAELPPAPPDGAFDVRFGSGRLLNVIDNEQQYEFPIETRSVVFPLDISWDVQSIKRPLYLSVDDREVPLHKDGMVRIQAPFHSLTLNAPGLNDQKEPSDYTLDRAFPNPFNPATTIRFHLPIESHVLLKVFNLLGQEVATLKNGIQPKGAGTVVWNAEQVGSGMYFILLDAVATGDVKSSFTQVIKVVLQK